VEFQVILLLGSVPVLLRLRHALNSDTHVVAEGENDVPLGWHAPLLFELGPATRAPEPRLEMILRLGMLTEEPGSDVPVRFGFGRVGRELLRWNMPTLGQHAQSQDHLESGFGRARSWTEFKQQRRRETGSGGTCQPSGTSFSPSATT
jgi:hypothetical protein